MGRGMRRKRFTNPFSSDDSSDCNIKKYKHQGKSKSTIPATPLPPPFPVNGSSLKKSLNIVSKETISALTVSKSKKQDKTATASSEPSTSGNTQQKLLNKIINLRQQAANKAQQRKKAMSLENTHKLPVKKKAVNNSTLSCKSLMKTAETCESSRSESQSIISPLNSQSAEESSYSSEMSHDIEHPLPQLSYRSVLDKTQNPVTQYLYGSSSTSDYTHQTPTKESSEFVANENRNEIDIESDKVSLVPSQALLISQLFKGTIMFI